MHTHPPRRSRWCSAPRRGAARSPPCEPPPSSRSWDRGAALTGLGLTARVGNLQLEGEPGKRQPCSIASTSSEEGARSSSAQATLPALSRELGAGAGSHPAFRLHMDRVAGRGSNMPPGGSGVSIQDGEACSLRCQVEGGRGGGAVGRGRSSFGCLPTAVMPPSPVSQAWRAGCPCQAIGSNCCLDPLVSTGLACLRIPMNPWRDWQTQGISPADVVRWPGAWIGWEY